jgi:hypothetical protein
MGANPPPAAELHVNPVDPQVEAEWHALLSGDHQGNSSLRKLRRVFSEEAHAAAGIATEGLQARQLDLKGIDRPIAAWLATAEVAA